MKTTWTIKRATFDSALVDQGDLLAIHVDGEFVGGWRGVEWVAPPPFATDVVRNALALVGPNGGFFDLVEVEVAENGDAVVTTGDEYLQTIRCGGYAHARCV